MEILIFIISSDFHFKMSGWVQAYLSIPSWIASRIKTTRYFKYRNSEKRIGEEKAVKLWKLSAKSYMRSDLRKLNPEPDPRSIMMCSNVSRLVTPDSSGNRSEGGDLSKVC